MPPLGLTQIPIWPAGAPDMTDTQRNAAPETATAGRKVPGQDNTDVANVTVPTITVYPPKGKNSGASILVFPGGGFRILAMGIEGTEICDWISSRGITCVLLKYRVPKGNHYWDEDCKCHITPPVPWALQDAQRAIRLVRARANELHIDPHKIGVIGFSAGGYLVAQTSNIFESTYKRLDAADDLSSRPDFAMALYPGHFCSRSGELFDQGFQVSRQAPPTFLLQAWDDPVDNICNSTVYARALSAAGVSAEVHLFAKGGHAFALRPNSHPVSSWPTLLEHWLGEIGVL
jgi:acetyl esterase/lipase